MVFTIEEINRDIKKAEEHWNKMVELGWKGFYKQNTPESIEEWEKGNAVLEKYRELCNNPTGFPEGDNIIDYLWVIINWEEQKQ